MHRDRADLLFVAVRIFGPHMPAPEVTMLCMVPFFR